MATWTNIPNTSIETDKPIRAVDGRALRDNPIAIAEGASGAPKIQNAAMGNNSVDNANVVNGTLGAEKFQTGTTERDWVRARIGGIPYTSGSLFTLYERAAEASSGATSPFSKLGEIIVVLGTGTVSYSFDLKTNTAGRGAQGVILRDGVVVVSENNDSLSYQTYSGSISVSFGQTLEFRYGDDGGLSNLATTQNVIFSASY